MRKIGLKVFSTNDYYFEPAIKLYNGGAFDYLEIYLVAGESRNFIGKWIELEIPLAFHAPHSIGGFNPSQESMKKKNEIIIEEVAEICREYKPLYLVFHSGTNGTVHEAIKQFNQYFSMYPHLNQVALIENKPLIGVNDLQCIGATPREIKLLMAQTQMGFCLDFGHAICAAKSISTDWMLLIGEFLDLNPMSFHLSDGNIFSQQDDHLHLGSGNYDLHWILSKIPENGNVAIETEKDSKTSLDDFAMDTRVFRSIEKEVEMHST
jgi:endonuclease IV